MWTALDPVIILKGLRRTFQANVIGKGLSWNCFELPTPQETVWLWVANKQAQPNHAPII